MIFLIIYWLVTLYFLKIGFSYLLQVTSGSDYLAPPGSYYAIYTYVYPIVLSLWGGFITYKWIRAGRKLSSDLKIGNVVLLVGGGAIFLFLSSLSLYSLKTKF